jgi:hypothetical protein
LIERRTFVWGLEMMLLQVLVGDDVVIAICVLLGAEVPWLLLGVILTLF